METRFANSTRFWLSALLLAVVLGAQSVQAAHVHGDHLQGPDCVQCKLDNGHALLPEQHGATQPVAAPASPRLLAPAAPVATAYRLPARGPPTLSS